MTDKSVKLISVTKPIGGIIDLSPEDLIVYIARVSNPQNQLNTKTTSKLLKYCIDNKHWSIFEMAHMTLEITTSRAISAQILRHRSFSFQEFSTRYSKANEYVSYDARRQDEKNRQNSIDDMDENDKKWFLNSQKKVWDLCGKLYEDSLQKGIAKEQARFLLPMNTKTKLYMSGSIRSWITYLMVRLDPSTQKEHRDIAVECSEIFKEQFPNIHKSIWKST